MYRGYGCCMSDTPPDRQSLDPRSPYYDEAVSAPALAHINHLSDRLFVAFRPANTDDAADTEWTPGREPVRRMSHD